MSLNFKDIYGYETWLVNYNNAQGYEEKYLEYCEKFANDSEFPNVLVGQIDMITGGVFSKEQTAAVGVAFEKPTLKGLGIYFRPKRFGNLVHYSLIKTVDSGFWGSARGEDKIAQMMKKMKNMAQVDEFFSLDGLGDLIFTKALLELDPNFKEIKSLMSKGRTSEGRLSGS
ncbi:MAG: hypothetical protein GY768_26760 [Planctomycetaceae bacterium]|nr:hypothetical protein [Planctomycetaceae bacterium]